MDLKDLTTVPDLLQPPSYLPPTPPKSANPARWTYERLGKLVKDFEAELDDQHEIGSRLVSFGVATEFHIEDVGYWGPDIITFRGVNDRGETVELIQHVSQLSVLLVAMKKQGDKPRRIGFTAWEEEAPPSK